MRRTKKVKGLRLWYNSFNIRYILCNNLFKVFLERLMSKEKPTLLLAIKMWNLCTILMRRTVIFFTHSHRFFYRIYSLQV